MRSNSPSDCSEGTGDEQQSSKKPKRRSFRTKKKKQLDSETGQVASPPWSDSDLGLPSSSRGIQEDDASFDGSREYGSPGRVSIAERAPSCNKANIELMNIMTDLPHTAHKSIPGPGSQGKSIYL